MVHVEKIVVKGKKYYKLVHSVRKDGKVKGISKYLGKVLPPPQELEKLKQQFLAKILADRKEAQSTSPAVTKDAGTADQPGTIEAETMQKVTPKQAAQELDQKYLTPMQRSFELPERAEGKSSPNFQEVAKNLHEVVYVADPQNYLVTYVSPFIKDLLGYTPVEWLADSTLLERLIHPEDKETFILEFEKALQSKSPWEMKYRVNTRAGRTIWLQHRIFWEKDGQGYITSLVGVLEDVTFEQESQEQVAVMFDDSPVAMMEMDFSRIKLYLDTYELTTKKGVWQRFAEQPQELQEVKDLMRIVSLNRAVLTLFKATDREKFVSLFHSKSFFRDSNAVFIEEVMAIAQGKTDFESKLNVFLMNGRRIQIVIKWKVPRLYHKSYSKVLVTYLDTSFQREMGRIMNVKNHAIESSPGATVITDLEGSVTYANPAFLDMWSIDNLSSIMEKSITTYFPDQQKGLEILHQIHLQEKWKGELILGTENQQIFLRSNGMVVRDSFDEPIAIVFSFIDITEVRKSEQIRLEFTNIAAHELKTPLVPLQTLLTMIYEDPKQFGVNKQGMKHLTVCMRNVSRLNVLIGDILDISRLEAGGMTFKEGTYNMGEIAREVVANFKQAIEKKGVTLRSQIPRKLPILHGDGQKISQVLGNLVKNAINFTDQGSIFIQVSLIRDHIKVAVIDTGIGIPKSAQAKLFTKFYQVQDITTRRSKGSGLGLAISKGIIQHHGGQIYIFSEGAGTGSTFSFTLPIKPVHRQEEERKAERAKLIGDKMLLGMGESSEVTENLSHAGQESKKPQIEANLPTAGDTEETKSKGGKSKNIAGKKKRSPTRSLKKYVKGAFQKKDMEQQEK